MIKLVKVAETCGGCPSQWDAWDEDGDYYYLRFRFGQGTVDTGASQSSPWVRFAEFSHGDDMAGVIDLETFARLAGLDVSEAEHAPKCFDHGYANCTLCN